MDDVLIESHKTDIDTNRQMHQLRELGRARWLAKDDRIQGSGHGQTLG